MEDNPTKDPIDVVAGYLVAGSNTGEIFEYLDEQALDRDESLIVMEQALAKLAKSARMPAGVRKGWCLEALRGVYRQAVEAREFSVALGAVKEIAKLSDLYGTGPAKDEKEAINAYIDEVLTLS